MDHQSIHTVNVNASVSHVYLLRVRSQCGPSKHTHRQPLVAVWTIKYTQRQPLVVVWTIKAYATHSLTTSALIITEMACTCKPWLTSLCLSKQLPQYFSFFQQCLGFSSDVSKRFVSSNVAQATCDQLSSLILNWTIISQCLRTAKPELYGTLRLLMHHPPFSATILSALRYTLARIIIDPPQRRCHLTCTVASCLGIAYLNVKSKQHCILHRFPSCLRRRPERSACNSRTERIQNQWKCCALEILSVRRRRCLHYKVPAQQFRSNNNSNNTL
ncbi:hypothetical protein BCR37DRAFT_221005 [Protomyces lactucae-debilis]|uniref:Uncharacterized protein n=1 Tax=Protomyces lactucae-debilis TaxID=2754530 RepID=A0A1Y2FSZ3_PROLT|nr:uncharacterized protein BCR37DRAFT_221005 [Protomyces lactucae-debilis]ORY86434.1 hypothetical protein BCR37DRAFT_221005 [Protomyces lactucae-debilis]